MRVLLAILVLFMAAPGDAMTVTVTGHLNGPVNFTNYGAGPKTASFEGNDGALAGWRGAEIGTMSTGSMDLYQVTWNSGETEVRAKNCTGLLLFACRGISYDTTLSAWDRSFNGATCICIVDFSPLGYRFIDDGGWGWANGTGRYQFEGGVDYSVVFDSFRVGDGPVSEVPLPSSALMLLTATAGFVGWRRVRSQRVTA